MVANHGPAPVLLVEGEILVGLKQNRVLNVSALVPASAEVEIPVTCVEAGRWQFTSGAGARDAFHLSPKVRAGKAESVADSARLEDGFRADQDEVWNGVAEQLALHGVRSSSEAYSDIGLQRGSEIRARLAAVRPEHGQIGTLAIVGGQPVCLDLFDREETLAEVWDGLVGSYVSDALVEEDGGAPPRAVARAQSWVREVAAGDAGEHAGVGLGTTVVLTGRH